MPIYEYLCQACRRRFSALVGVTADSAEVECPRCQGTDLRKLVSRFSRLRSEDEIFESLADSADVADVDESDPRAMARFMRKMGKEMGDEMGEDFDEAIEEAESELDSASSLEGGLEGPDGGASV
ncbi:MAG TPA: FmdB family zinc ribbon protein [Armatimonadota bacterium]|jgi:putative FmdB family regulatory protein